MNVTEWETWAVRIKGGYPDPVYITPFDTKEEGDAYICTLDWEMGRSYAVVRVLESLESEEGAVGDLPKSKIVEVG